MTIKKKILIAVILFVVIAAAVAVGFAAHSFAVSRESAAEFKSALNSLIDENEKLEQRKEELKSNVSETEKNIESKNEIRTEADEYADRLNELKAQVDASNRTLTEMDASIKKKNEYIEKADGIKRLSRGRSVSLSDKTLKCSDDIAAGRYIAEGRGNLLIYNADNKLRISENLSSIDTNSFTFDIEEGESVKATESFTLTMLK